MRDFILIILIAACGVMAIESVRAVPPAPVEDFAETRAIVALKAEASIEGPATITVKDVSGVCWNIAPRQFVNKGGLFAYQQTVVFEQIGCPK